MTVNNKEENSEDFCLDLVQEFSLGKAGARDLCWLERTLKRNMLVTVLQGTGGSGGGGVVEGGGGGGGEGDPTDVSSSYSCQNFFFWYKFYTFINSARNVFSVSCGTHCGTGNT